LAANLDSTLKKTKNKKTKRPGTSQSVLKPRVDDDLKNKVLGQAKRSVIETKL
jgi:hypothetical protein